MLILNWAELIRIGVLIACLLTVRLRRISENGIFGDGLVSVISKPGVNPPFEGMISACRQATSAHGRSQRLSAGLARWIAPPRRCMAVAPPRGYPIRPTAPT